MISPREDIRPTLARWANALAVVVAGFLPAAFALVALASAIGAPSEAKDARILVLGQATAFAGLVLALAAFLLATASRVRREPSDSLTFPFALLPLIVAVMVLVGLFWVG